MPMSTRRKAPAKLAAPLVKPSARVQTRSAINESRASVSVTDALQGYLDTIEISSDADSNDAASAQDDDQEPRQTAGQEDAESPLPANGTHAAVESDGEPTSPTFGDMLRDSEATNAPTLASPPPALATTSRMPSMTTTAAVLAADTTALLPSSTVIVPPSHQSLTTVLSQALRTDDTDLLESCLHTTDLTTIKNTIEQIDSSLAGNLLTKLAARLHRRPGRAGNLMIWVQWTLIAHGGALAAQPEVIHGLSGLQTVLAERAKGLNSLLALKGKLDLLEGQMMLRRKMQRDSGRIRNREDAGAEEDEDEEENVIWVEGETDTVAGEASPDLVTARIRPTQQDQDEDLLPAVNGLAGHSDDEEERSDMDDYDDDDDADGGDGGEQPLDEDEVDHDVDESGGEDEESDAADAVAPPSKLRKGAKSPFTKSK